MPHVIKLSLLAFGLLVSSHASAADLTEAAIHKLIAEADRSIAHQSADGIEKLFSDKARITLHMSAQGQSQTATLSKPEYIASLRQSWGMYDSYEYNRSGLNVTLHGNQAFVTDTITEAIRVQGQSLTAVTKEEVTVELVGGKPMITNVVGYTSM